MPGRNSRTSDGGKNCRIMQERGTFLDCDSGATIFITIHPSSIYRLQEKDEQEKEYRRFVGEMKSVQRKLRSMAAA